MRNRYTALCMLLGMILASAPSHAQTQARKPDLNGIWQAVNSANWDVEGHGAAPGPVWQLGAEFSIPPGLGIVEGGPIPYKPEALQKMENCARYH